MSDRPIRLLFITSLPPLPTWGTSMTYYRHFCERPDFVMRVVTDHAHVHAHRVPYAFRFVEHGRRWKRLSQTRLYQWVHSWYLLVTSRRLTRVALAAARDFRPDAIMTVGGSWFWTVPVARAVADRLQLPLIGSFNGNC